MQTDGQPLGPHSDLTYRVIEDLVLEGTDLRQCLFTGAVFRRTVFRNVNFRRSDFDAARFEGCEFFQCDLSIDMRSALFAETAFIDCVFGTAFITDCSFDKCTFERIHFDDCAVSHNEFQACTLRDCSLKQSTFVHNSVYRSIFSATNMGDCTFLYAIMKGCSFKECVMNLESVGMIYGLTADDLQGFRYVHLGIDERPPQPEHLVDVLFQQYVDRRWRLSVAIMRLNFRLTAPLYTFHQYLNDTQEAFAAGTPLNREEMLFVAKLMTELALESRLPLATCFDVSRWCAALADLAHESASLDAGRTTEVLRELSSKAMALSHDGLRSIEASQSGRVLTSGGDAPVFAKFEFKTRPTVDVSGLLTTVAAETGLVIYQNSYRVSTQTGSWIEYIQTTMVSLAAIRVFLYFINGVLYDVTEARARATTLVRSRLPREFIDLALRPQAPISASLVTPLKAIANEALRTLWVNDPRIGGLDAPNVNSVEVIVDPKTRTSDEEPQ